MISPVSSTIPSQLVSTAGALPGRILVVDDDPMARTIFEKSLQQQGHQVCLAAGPAEAETRLGSAEFDLVISDVCMPGNTRLQWVEHLLAREDHPPILLVTGSPDIENACRAANLPIVGLLLKPVDLAALGDLVGRLLDAQSRHREWAGLSREILAACQSLTETGALEYGPLAAKLRQLVTAYPVHRGRLAAVRAGDHAWRTTIAETIAVLEKTRHSFRSKELGHLRQRLQQVLARPAKV